MNNVMLREEVKKPQIDKDKLDKAIEAMMGKLGIRGK